MGTSSSPWIDLQQRLEDAKLAGTKLPEGGYTFRSNEKAAGLAHAIFMKWLLEREHDGDPEDHAQR